MAAVEPTAGVESAAGGKTIKITLVRSPIGYIQRQRATARALGLRKMHQTVEKPDTPEVRAMAHSIAHMVRIEE